jgi:hypothetical protein
MSESGDSCIQPGGTLAVRDQEAKEYPDGRGAPLRRSPSALLASLQDKLSQTLRIEPSGVLTDTFQQVAEIKAVVVEGGIAGPTLLPHPAAEIRPIGPDSRWIPD